MSAVPSLEQLKSMSGIDFLRAIVAGKLPAPPIADTLGFAITEVTGRLRCASR